MSKRLVTVSQCRQIYFDLRIIASSRRVTPQCYRPRANSRRRTVSRERSIDFSNPFVNRFQRLLSVTPLSQRFRDVPIHGENLACGYLGMTLATELANRFFIYGGRAAFVQQAPERDSMLLQLAALAFEDGPFLFRTREKRDPGLGQRVLRLRVRVPKLPHDAVVMRPEGPERAAFMFSLVNRVECRFPAAAGEVRSQRSIAWLTGRSGWSAARKRWYRGGRGRRFRARRGDDLAACRIQLHQIVIVEVCGRCRIAGWRRRRCLFLHGLTCCQSLLAGQPLNALRPGSGTSVLLVDPLDGIANEIFLYGRGSRRQPGEWRPLWSGWRRAQHASHLSQTLQNGAARRKTFRSGTRAVGPAGRIWWIGLPMHGIGWQVATNLDSHGIDSLKEQVLPLCVRGRAGCMPCPEPGRLLAKRAMTLT
ncbi:hypothetical protein PQR72_28165 [Paraburkholderia madseniana]|uniref:hypothetical protein n=1 Tax=Paraburkholderia madseniana TaxID=2599607 RepID=UPI0015C57186|nr:hypothetical protein [Paraburkholderia madseniana]NPT69850.1 hypothetical protein [Paraburkholderia madseniana]